MFPLWLRPFLISVFIALFFVNVVDYFISRIDEEPASLWTILCMFLYPLAITSNVIMLVDER